MAALVYSCVEGSKVELVSDDGVYIGILHKSSGDKITLEKVKSKTTGKQLSGLLHFYSREIKKVTVLNEKCREVEKDDRMGPRLCHKKQKPEHIERFRTRLPTVAHLSYSTATLTSLQQSSGNLTLLPRAQSFPLQKDATSRCFGNAVQEKSVADDLTKVSRDGQRDIHMPLSYSIICQLDEHYLAAIDHLQQQSIVGLAVEGVDIGRYGHLCWLQVGTREHVFLFDMIVLGGACFQQGLADILSSHTLQKVVHDCRKMSDMLWHQYQVQMVNIFDTQVADMNVYQLRHRGDLPYYTKSLPACLFEHLSLTTEQVFIYKIREESLKEDQSMWMLRPASDVILDAAVKNVAFLLELRIALLERMLSRFVDGVDVYLSVIRDASKQQFSECHNTQSHLIPEEFRRLETEAMRCRALSLQIAGPECISGATNQQTEELPKHQLEQRRRGYATTRHHDDTTVDSAAVTQEKTVLTDTSDTLEEGNLLSSVNQTSPLVADAVINRPVQNRTPNGVTPTSAQDCQVTTETISADNSLLPTSGTNVPLPRAEPVNKLVFIAGGHEMSLSRTSEPDPIPINARQSRRCGADSSYSTGSSDDIDEYNMIPSHNLIRSGASSEQCVADQRVSDSPRVVDNTVRPKRHISGSPVKTPKGVSAQNTTAPPRHGVCVGRAKALHVCLQRLSLSPGEAGSVSNAASLMSPPTRYSSLLDQFRDVDSDTSTGDVSANEHSQDADLGSGQAHIPDRSGIGRSATLARYVT